VVTAGPEKVLSCVVSMHGFLLGTEEDGISNGEHGANSQSLIHTFVALRLDNCLSQHRVTGEFSHPSSELGQVTVVIQGSQSIQLFKGSDKRLWWRRVHEIEVNQIINTERLQHEDDRSQVGSLYFWNGGVIKLIRERPSRKQSETLAGRHSPSTTCSLVSRGF